MTTELVCLQSGRKQSQIKTNQNERTAQAKRILDLERQVTSNTNSNEYENRVLNGAHSFRILSHKHSSICEHISESFITDLAKTISINLLISIATALH